MSRIQFAVGNGSLTPLIRAHIGRMIQPLADHRAIREIVVVGNTAMRQIFSGADVQPLSCAPFVVPDLDDASFAPADLGWNLAGDCPVDSSAASEASWAVIFSQAYSRPVWPRLTPSAL